MRAQRKAFSCAKAMVLGALYDTAERLKWKLLSANSDTGIFVVAERSAGVHFLVRVIPGESRQFEITVELTSGVFSNRNSPEDAAACFLETLTQIIEDALAKAGHPKP